MSQSLPTVDLSTATIGQRGTVDWQQQTNQSASASGYSSVQVRGATGQAPKLQIFNESGCGLQITLSTSEQLFIPAGGWLQVEIQPSCTSYEWLVLYAIPNPPVSSLINIYYYPYETPPNTPILGNSPVGIGGSVSTVQTQAIKNDGSVPATSIIEATPSDQINSSWAMNNDASGFVQVLSANVMRKVLNVVRGNATTGKAVIDIGDTNDKTITTYHGLLETISSDAGKISSDGTGLFRVNNLQVITPGSNDALQIIKRNGSSSGLLTGYGDGGSNPTGFYIYDQINAQYIVSGALGLANSATGGRLLQSRTNGGGNAGVINWQGTTDPGTAAGEGDTWDKG